MPIDLQDRVIAITGASSGIGAATALACARAGMHVALSARRVQPMQALAEQIRAMGRRATVTACDVSVEEEVERWVREVSSEFGRIDAAYANAGYGVFASVEATTDRQMRDIFETNFHGTMRLIRAVLPVMRRQGRGHIVICSSAASEISLPMYGAYCATKAAQDSIAGALRAELAGSGIAVSSVHPIGTTTAFFEFTRDGGKVRSNTPDWMMQSPEHVARCIVRALRRPRPEVWPSPLSRFGLALTTAFPSLAARLMGHRARKLR